MKRLIIDTDPGIDDAAAILLALASPELAIEAMTTVYGNGNIASTTQNTLKILEIAGRSDIPVYQGTGKPLLREAHIAHHVHGHDAMGDVGLPAPAGCNQPEHAVNALIDRVMANPGEITLLALGPLTNVALALSLEPRLAGALTALVLMGGAVLTHGNTSEVASANLYNDPEAAAIVYQSGAPIVQVGLDVCRQAMIPMVQWGRIQQADSPTMKFLTRITPHIAEFYARRAMLYPGMAVAYNDVPAVAYLVQPELFDGQDLYVRIATHDELTKGQTVADLGDRWGHSPNAHVLLNVRGAELTEMFTDRVIGYERPA